MFLVLLLVLQACYTMQALAITAVVFVRYHCKMLNPSCAQIAKRPLTPVFSSCLQAYVQASAKSSSTYAMYQPSLKLARHPASILMQACLEISSNSAPICKTTSKHLDPSLSHNMLEAFLFTNLKAVSLPAWHHPRGTHLSSTIPQAGCKHLAQRNHLGFLSVLLTLPSSPNNW